MNAQLDGGESAHVLSHVDVKPVTTHGATLPVSDMCAQQMGLEAGQSEGMEHASVAPASQLEVHAFICVAKVAQQS